MWIAVWDFANGHATAAVNPSDRGDLPGFLQSVSTGAAMQITCAGGVKIMLSAGPSYADDVVRDFAQVTSVWSVA